MGLFGGGYNNNGPLTTVEELTLGPTGYLMFKN